MPIFVGRDCFGYSTILNPDDFSRKWSKRLTRLYVIPYLYGVLVSLVMEIKPPRNLGEPETLRYDWELTNFDGTKHYNSGNDIANIQLGKTHRQRIILGYLELPGEYKLTVTFTRNKEVTKPMTMAQFTVQDRDDFYRNTVIPTLTGIFGVVLGVVLGVIATILWGG